MGKRSCCSSVRALSLAVVCAGLLMGRVVAAQPARPGESDPLLRSADQLIAAGEHAGALALLRQLETRGGDPGVEGRLALEESAVGDYRRAEAHAQAALQAPDESWVAAHAEALALVVTESARHLGTLIIDGLPAGTTASADGAQVAVLPAPLRLVAGAVVVVLTLPDGRGGTFRGTAVAQRTTHVDGTRYVGPAAPPVPGSPTATTPATPPTAAAPSLPTTPAQTTDASAPATTGLAVTTSSVQAWRDFAASPHPHRQSRLRRAQEFAAWRATRPGPRLVLTVSAGMTGIGKPFKWPTSEYLQDSSRINALAGLGARLVYALRSNIEFSSGLDVSWLGTYTYWNRQRLYYDPDYSRVDHRRRGQLLRAALDVGFRFGPGLTEQKPTFYLGLFVAPALDLFVLEADSYWYAPTSGRESRTDRGPTTSSVAARLSLIGRLEAGAYLNASHSLELAAAFGFAPHGWDATLRLGIVIAGGQRRQPETEEASRQ
ncbi:MAG: hypothetical protein GXP55_09260 [Deltaproteobacteria bacterium]|nr:hypothetical protein [Deltaproteobacteria bacterium]